MIKLQKLSFFTRRVGASACGGPKIFWVVWGDAIFFPKAKGGIFFYKGGQFYFLVTKKGGSFIGIGQQGRQNSFECKRWVAREKKTTDRLPPPSKNDSSKLSNRSGSDLVLSAWQNVLFLG